MRRAAGGAALSPRPATNGSVSNPRNRFIASKVVCCEPVASSPEICVRPAGVSAAEHHRNAAIAVEEADERVGGILLIDVETAAELAEDEVQREIEKYVMGIVAQARLEAGGNAERIERTEGATDAAGRGQDGVLLRHVIAGQERRARAAVQRAVPLTLANVDVAGLSCTRYSAPDWNARLPVTVMDEPGVPLPGENMPPETRQVA